MYQKSWQTAESVTEGHPDKICDQISDAILDEYLLQDANSRVAVETVGGHGQLYIIGEVTSSGKVDAARIAQKVYEQIGYTDKLKIVSNIVHQSPDIALGVDTGGAGDQGMMYGFATDETPEMLPKPLVLAHRLTRELTRLRKNDPAMSWLRPDGKAQITIRNGTIDTVVVSTQHAEEIETDELRKQIVSKLIEPIVGSDIVNTYINPTGRFVPGGFEADTGLTGRKIMVDSYGGLAPQGGGCFSGKDATKVDRSAAYMARYLAKQIVARGDAKECLVSLAYAIGHAEPVMVDVWTDTNYNGRDWITKNFDLSPAGIIKFLDLKKPVFMPTAVNGHFGNPAFSWEKIASS